MHQEEGGIIKVSQNGEGGRGGGGAGGEVVFLVSYNN